LAAPVSWGFWNVPSEMPLRVRAAEIGWFAQGYYSDHSDKRL